MSVPTRQATPGPSMTITGSLNPQLHTVTSKKRSGSAVIEDTRDTKKVKVEGGALATVSLNQKEKEKEKRKKKKKKKRRTSVVSAILRSPSKPSSPVALTSVKRPQSPEAAKRPAKFEDEDGVVLSSPDKGKGKAQSKSPARRVTTPPASEQPVASTSGSSNSAVVPDQTSEIKRLKEQLTAQTALLTRHQNHMSHHQQALTCQICLDLMHKPYALVPCGHITCYGCLVRWFTAAQNPELAGGADAQNDSIETILNSVSARNGAYLRRRKNCPVCRAVVAQRPMEMWGIKSMVTSLVKSGLVELPILLELAVEENIDNNHDPWLNIFLRPNGRHSHHHHVHMSPPPGPGPQQPPGDNRADMGWFDAEDGGIYRCTDCYHEILYGRCTGCDRLFQGHYADDDGDDDDGMDTDEDAAQFRGGIQRIMDALMEGDPHEDDEDDDEDSGEEDLFNQMWPMHEQRPDMINGAYPYPELFQGGVEMDSDASDSEEEALENFLALADRFYRHRQGSLPPLPNARRAARIEEVGDEDDDDEGSDYEGSFIDDGAEHQDVDPDDDDEVEIVEDDEEEEDDEVDVLDRPPGQPLRGLRPPRVYVVSDEEDDEEPEAELPPGRFQRLARRNVVLNLEEEDEDEGPNEDEDEDGNSESEPEPYMAYPLVQQVYEGLVEDLDRDDEEDGDLEYW